MGHSTIAPLHAELVAFLAKAKEMKFSKPAAFRAFAQKHKLHPTGVSNYAIAKGLVPLRPGMERLKSLLVEHIKNGGDQKSFAEKRGISKGNVSRVCRNAGYQLRLIHDSEWKLILGRRSQ